MAPSLVSFAEVVTDAANSAATAAGNTDPEALVDALKTVRVMAPQGSVVMDPVTQHASVNCFLTRCNRKVVFDIIQAFELQPPVIPERYRHQQISNHANVEEDVRLQARMLEQMQGGVMLIDSGSQIVLYANAGAEKMFGYPSGDLATWRPGDLATWRPAMKTSWSPCTRRGPYCARRGLSAADPAHGRTGRHRLALRPAGGERRVCRPRVPQTGVA